MPTCRHPHHTTPLFIVLEKLPQPKLKVEMLIGASQWENVFPFFMQYLEGIMGRDDRKGSKEESHLSRSELSGKLANGPSKVIPPFPCCILIVVSPLNSRRRRTILPFFIHEFSWVSLYQFQRSASSDLSWEWRWCGRTMSNFETLGRFKLFKNPRDS